MNAFSLFGFMRMLGMLPPVEGDTPPAGDGDPAEGTTPPVEGTTPPAEGTTPPVEGTTPPAEGTTPPAEGTTPPAEGTTPPVEGGAPPAEDDVTGNEMQEILDGLRESLSRKDADIDTLADSVLSLVDVMSADGQSDIYVPPDIPIEGYLAWRYPVTVDYLVSVVGFGEPVLQSGSYPDPDIFLEDYQSFAYECFLGTAFKDFYIDKVTDADGVLVYDSQAGTEEPEEPPEDLHPVILETLQTMDARLEYLNAALDDLSSVSGNSIAYYEDSVKLYRQSNELLTHILAVDLALFCIVVVLLGHSIAHAFWERMRVG